MFIKFTGPEGTATSGNGYKWPLPTKNEDGSWTPGEWAKPIEGDLVACKNGYHFTDAKWCAGWIDAEMYEIEIDGECITDEDMPKKHVCRRARLLRRFEKWDDNTARLFAVRCARDAMELVANPDPRSITAIDTAERFANGEATVEELAAARAAAWAAARAAAQDAAWAAARDAAQDAAWAAAQDAAWAAARDAAYKKYSAWLIEAVK